MGVSIINYNCCKKWVISKLVPLNGKLRISNGSIQRFGGMVVSHIFEEYGEFYIMFLVIRSTNKVSFVTQGKEEYEYICIITRRAHQEKAGKVNHG